MHTDEQVFKTADKTIAILYSLSDYDNGKNVDVYVTLDKDGQSHDYIAVYTKQTVDNAPAWVHSHIKKG
jgi:hypothetical protein